MKLFPRGGKFPHLINPLVSPTFARVGGEVRHTVAKSTSEGTYPELDLGGAPWVGRAVERAGTDIDHHRSKTPSLQSSDTPFSYALGSCRLLVGSLLSGCFGCGWGSSSRDQR